MTLREQQSLFARKVSDLIAYAYAQGYKLTFGDAWAKTGHSKNSKHYDRLAIDLNLFKDGKYLSKTEDHRFLGEYWESLHPGCTWGGRFRKNGGDGNHYSFQEGKK